MQGVIQSMEYSKKGAPKFQINGSWYYAGRCKVDGLHVGAAIEFESKPFGDRGTLNGMEWWKPAQGQPANGAAQTEYARQATVTQGGKPAGNPQDRVSPMVTITEVDVLRSVSNIVGSACQAGTVKSPEELEKWFVAAWAGLLRKTPARPLPVGADPEFNDDLPPLETYSRESGSDDY
jgi:hypothetical protein